MTSITTTNTGRACSNLFAGRQRAIDLAAAPDRIAFLGEGAGSFNTVALSPKIDVPTLFLVAGKDTYVRRERTEILIQSWQAPYGIVEMPEASHHDIYYHDQYWQGLFKFIRWQAASH